MCQPPKQNTINWKSVIFLCLHFPVESGHTLLLSNFLDFVPCDLQLQRTYLWNGQWLKFSTVGDWGQEILEIEHDIFKIFAVSAIETSSRGCPRFRKCFSDIVVFHLNSIQNFRAFSQSCQALTLVSSTYRARLTPTCWPMKLQLFSQLEKTILFDMHMGTSQHFKPENWARQKVLVHMIYTWP